MATRKSPADPTTTNYPVASDLFLVSQQVSKTEEAKPAAPPPTNHIVCIDCSGSMYSDLPRLRDGLKNRLPSLIGEKDTLSIIWFSGRGEHGVLIEAEPVATLTDLSNVNKAIDRWINCVGLTGFKEPIEDVAQVAERVAKKRPGTVCSLIFMSDGGDNQWSRPDILKAMEKAAKGLASTTIVEYGYYADRTLLAQMAEKAGGALIFARDFGSYVPAFEGALQKKPAGAKRVEVAIGGDPVGGFVYALVDNDLITYAVEGGKVTVPEGLSRLYYLSPSMVGGTRGGEITTIAKGPASDEHGAINAAYAAVSLFSVRMKPDVVYPLLKSLGDVAFIERFSTCFGKPKYSEFMDLAKQAAFGKGRFTKGYDPSRVPREDAFTVLDLLEILTETDENRVLLDDPAFKYNPIGRGRVDASETFSAAETAEMEAIQKAMAGEKDAKKVKELSARLAALTASKGEALKFVATPAPDGYSVSSLNFHEERPNISFLVRKTGTVDISSRLTPELKGKLPEVFPTFIYRNYAVVKDGMGNIDRLPVKLSADSMAKIDAAVKDGRAPADIWAAPNVINVGILPVVNRKMTKAVSAKTLFEAEYELAKARGAQKVYNTIKKEKFPRKSEGFETQYGADAAKWLKEQGFTDYSGFGPKVVQAEAKDVYMAKELSVSLKGLSTIPSLKEAKEKIAKGKVTASVQLMKPAIDNVETFLASEGYKKASDAEKDKLFEAWIDANAKATTTWVRALLHNIARLKFGVVVGQVWFSEFSSIEENTMTLALDGGTVEAKVEMKEVEQKI
jgi:hypothetical protein